MRPQDLTIRKARLASKPHLKYLVESRDSRGRRRRHFFKNRPAADEFVAKLKNELRDFGRGALDLSQAQRNDALGALGILGGVASLVEVARFYLEHHASRDNSKTLLEAATAYFGIKTRQGLSERHLKDVRLRLGRFVADHGESTNSADIIPSTVQQWLDGMGLGPQSRKNYLTVIKAFFAKAVAIGWSPSDPCQGIDAPKVVTDEPGILAPPQLRALLGAAEEVDSRFVPLLALQAFAGLRACEVARLTWHDIREGAVHITAVKSKTASRRLVEITEPLDLWLFPYRDSIGPVQPPNAESILRKIRQVAGIVPWPSNCLRHSAATYWCAATKNHARVAADLGHNLSVLHSHYRGLATAAQAAEWFAIKPEKPSSTIVPFRAFSGS